MNNLLETDFKKWIFTNKNTHNSKEAIYYLYMAVSENTSNEFCSIEENEGKTGFILKFKAVDQELELKSDPDRISFADYVKNSFIKREDIDNWRKENENKTEINKNNALLKDKHSPYAAQADVIVNPHFKEKRYFRIILFFSVFFYIALVAGIGYYINLLGFAGLIPVIITVLFFFASALIVKGIFVGMLKGNSVRITKDQFPEIYEIISDQSKRIGLKKIPEAYLMDGGSFNAFAMNFLNRDFIGIYAQVVETSLTGNSDILKFVIGHELGHVKRKHTGEFWISPGKLVPFLSMAYSRGREYTCDRYGYHFSPKGAEAGILVLSVGKELFHKVRTKAFIEDFEEKSDFWTFISEKFLTHPHAAKRMIQIKDYEELRKELF